MKLTNSLICLLVFALISSSCRKEKTLFRKLNPQRTGITFSNRINETEEYNILAFEYVYNGGGVAVADFNNDGLQDLFFTGNMVNNQLYLNLGKWSFRDITEAAGVEGADRWSSGIAVVDINMMKR